MPSVPSPLRTLLSRLSTAGVSYAALATLVAVAGLLAAAGNDFSSTTVLVLYGAAFLPYAAVLTGAGNASITAWWYVAAAAGTRAALISADPVLSDDIYRYIWDGRVGLSGVNPFVHPPSAEALSSLRDASIWPHINHPEVPTIYPPGAQYLFEFNAALGGGIAGLKALFVAFELLAVVVCWRWLREKFDRQQLLTAFAAYALNPLVFVEVAWSGHIDVVAWSLLAVGLVIWQFDDSPRSGAWASVSVGAGAAVKFLGLMSLPLLVFDRNSSETSTRPLRQRLAAPAIAVAVVAISYLPMTGAGAKLFSGFGTYAASWRGNDGGYRLVHETTAAALRSWSDEHRRADGGVRFEFEALDGVYRQIGWTKQWEGETVPDTTYTARGLAAIVGKFAAALVVGLALLWCLVLGSRPLEGTLLLFVVLYLFAPVLHPWYVAWLVPFAALRRRSTELLFSFTVLAAYLAWRSSELGGAWHVPTWAVAVEYGSVTLALWLESSLDSSPTPGASANRT